MQIYSHTIYQELEHFPVICSRLLGIASYIRELYAEQNEGRDEKSRLACLGKTRQQEKPQKLTRTCNSRYS